MTKRRHGAQHLGPYYRFAVAVLEPFLTIWTKRERKNLEILERDYPPNDGIIVAANHMSWFDPMNISHVLWDAGRPPRFLAKDSLFELPGLGQLLSGAGQIPVYRNSDDAALAIRAAVDAVNSGECVVIYPEGTMTRDPDIWPMTGRTGAAQLALMTGAPVIPLAQWGPQAVMRPYRTEFNILPRKTMYTLVGEPVDLDDLRGKEISKDVLENATRRIIDRITELLEELRGEPAPADRLDFRAWSAQRRGQEVPEDDSAATQPRAGPRRVSSPSRDDGAKRSVSRQNKDNARRPKRQSAGNTRKASAKPVGKQPASKSGKKTTKSS